MEEPLTSRPLRVLMVAECYLPSVNGVTNSIIRSANHLQGLGHRVELMAPRPARTAEDRPLPAGAPRPDHNVRSFGLPQYRSLRIGIPSIGQIERVIDTVQPDVVHLAAPTVMGSRVSSITNRRSIPTVAVFQTDLAGFVLNYRGIGMAAEPIWRWLRRIHNRTDLTLAPTPTVASGLHDRGFRPVRVWGRGVDLAQFDPRHRSEELRRSWGLDGRLAVGFVGRLAAEKRVERLAPLAANPGVQLVVVGDGPERRRLQNAMPTARFTGVLTGAALGQAMASLDLLVHTGEHETFCQTIQEAMASRVPVVAPAAGGPVDLIEPGVNGHLFRAGDDVDLVASVDRLVRNPEARRQLAEAGWLAVQDRTWSAIGDQLVGHYLRVIRGPGSRRAGTGLSFGEAA